MKIKKPYLSAAVLGVVIAVALFLVLDVVAPAFSTSAVTWLLAPVSAPTPAPGDAIPLKSIDGSQLAQRDGQARCQRQDRRQEDQGRPQRALGVE